MPHKEKNVSVSGIIISLLVIASVLFLKMAYIHNDNWYWGLLITLPLLLISIVDVRQSKHTILRNYPITGHLRYFLKRIRPELRQYFFRTDVDGKPFNRR